jgi:outer membrane biosynthesis protein TonB
MDDTASDPKIVDRLKNLPPFDEETPEEPKAEEKPEEVEELSVEEKVEEKVDEPEEKPKEEKQKERTKKEFEKLKKHNNDLKEEVETLKKKNILDSLIPVAPSVPEVPQWPQKPTTNVIPTAQQYPGVSQIQISETFKGLVDENGYVDTGLLIDTLKDLQDKNKLAEERANQAEQQTQTIARKFDDFERNEIMRSVHAKYPTLDPDNDEFDEKLWKFVRNEVIDQWMNGKSTDVMAAAEEGMQTLHGNDMKKAEKIKLEEAENAKKNINALGASQASQRESYLDHETLVQGTRLGKKGALAERLKQAGL